VSKKAVCILFTIALLSISASVFAQNIWTNGNATGIWNDPDNWSLLHVPGTGGWVGEAVSIQGAADVVTLNTAPTVGNFTLSSTAQILQGAANTLTIQGNADISTTLAGGFDTGIPLVMTGAVRTLTVDASQSL